MNKFLTLAVGAAVLFFANTSLASSVGDTWSSNNPYDSAKLQQQSSSTSLQKDNIQPTKCFIDNSTCVNVNTESESKESGFNHKTDMAVPLHSLKGNPNTDKP